MYNAYIVQKILKRLIDLVPMCLNSSVVFILSITIFVLSMMPCVADSLDEL